MVVSSSTVVGLAVATRGVCAMFTAWYQRRVQSSGNLLSRPVNESHTTPDQRSVNFSPPQPLPLNPTRKPFGGSLIGTRG
ncbi:hypothetical protein QBC45DRAFT_420772 [Copromyces sp. CBS 386.78]|nr:hypothetical protein QBC45DRAFT_420772 [Copromyces sp. CBS 386.78]